MKEAKLVIQNETGLHARPAATVVNAAKDFKSTMTVKKGQKEVNLKSLLSLLSLGIGKGEEITLKVDGEDENEAFDKIAGIIAGLKE